MGDFRPAIYPQPARSTLELRSDMVNKPDYKLELMDAVGHTVRTMLWPGHLSTISIDVKDLAEGSYVVRGQAEGMQHWSRSIIVAHRSIGCTGSTCGARPGTLGLRGRVPASLTLAPDEHEGPGPDKVSGLWSSRA